MAHYKEPDVFTRTILNPIVKLFTKAGISVAGSSVLRVRGRTSGETQEVPLNPLPFDGVRYLVAPRGETQWVRNVRAAGGHAELRAGREMERVVATEVADDEKPAILRAYLKKWKWEVGQFFDGGPDSPDEDLQRIAPNHPVFRLTEADPT
jgi:hypothetical protein